jgi:hypothetical protein
VHEPQRATAFNLVITVPRIVLCSTVNKSWNAWYSGKQGTSHFDLNTQTTACLLKVKCMHCCCCSYYKALYSACRKCPAAAASQQVGSPKHAKLHTVHDAQTSHHSVIQPVTLTHAHRHPKPQNSTVKGNQYCMLLHSGWCKCCIIPRTRRTPASTRAFTRPKHCNGILQGVRKSTETALSQYWALLLMRVLVLFPKTCCMMQMTHNAAPWYPDRQVQPRQRSMLTPTAGPSR